MKVRGLRWLGSRIHHAGWLLVCHRVALVLMKLWRSVWTVEPYSFRILSVIVVAVSLLLLILLLKFRKLGKKK